MLFLAHLSFSQLVISNQGGTANSLIQGFLGNGLTVNNPVINCPNVAYGTFSGGNSFGLTNGIVLTTGNTNQLAQGGANFMSTDNNSNCTDATLLSLDQGAGNDCCILEFDVVPQCTELTIKFVFGSEEYPEFAPPLGSVNDVFGFFVSGPNPSGGVYTNKNVATINGGATICSIDNINPSTNTSYYVDNQNGNNLVFDGYSIPIISTLNVTPCQTYHFKLAISDVMDGIYDSGVFIDFLQCSNALSANIVTTPSNCGTPDGTATATVTGGLGTLAYNWSPAPGGGQGTPNATGMSAGNYTLTVTDSYGCIIPLTQTVTIGGQPTPTVTNSPLTQSICTGGQTALVNLTASLPNSTFTWTATATAGITGFTANGTSTIPVQTLINSSANPGTVTYTITPSLNGCSGTPVNYVITVNPVPIATISGSTAICSGLTTNITFNGTPNTTVTFNDGTTNLTVTLDGMGNGSYTTPALTANTTYTLMSVVTAGPNSCSQNLNGNVIITVNPLPNITVTPTTICLGQTGTITANGGVGATFVWQDGSTLNTFSAAPATTTNYTVTGTLNNCSNTATGAINVITTPDGNINGSTSVCSGSSATINFTGTPNGVITYNINGAPNTTINLDNNGIATLTSPPLSTTTTYTLVQVDLGTCSQVLTNSITLTVLPLPTATISGTIAVCNGDAQPSITFTGNNATAPYTFSYNINGGATQTVSTTTGNAVNISVPTNVDGTFTYNLLNVSESSTGLCSQTQNGTATITIHPLPTAIISGSTTICQGSTATLTINGTPNSTVTYNDGTNTNTIILNNTGVGTITTPSLANTITYTLTNVTSATNPSCNTILNSWATISVIPTPFANIFGTATICSGTTTDITFVGTPNSTVTFTDGFTNLNTILGNTGTGTYTTPTLTSDRIYTLVSVSTASTPVCSLNLSDFVTVTIKQLPTGSILGNNTICQNSTAIITFGGTPDATINYTEDGALKNITLDNTGFASYTTPNLSNTTIYNITSVTSSGTPVCSNNLTGSVTITVINFPTASIFNDTTICNGKSAIVNFSGTPNAAISYTINGTNPATGTIGPNGILNFNTGSLTATTSYELTGVALTTSPFCAQVLNQEIEITIEEYPVVDFSPNITFGCTPLNVVFTNNSTNSVNCSWNFGNLSTDVGCDVVSNEYKTAGCFDVTLTVSSAHNCVSTMTKDNLICVEPSPVAHYDPDPDTISIKESTVNFVNSSQNAVSYYWDLGDGNSSIEDNPTHEYNISGEYGYNTYLIATSSSGCKDTFEVYIKVLEELIFYIPNTFTPDGDAFNQTWNPVFTSGIDPYDYNLVIYNRWGEIVFESKNSTIGWDGTYDGKLVPDGIYTYQIFFKIRNNDERKTFIGSLNMIR